MDNYFIWSGKPELFTIPKIPLPFSVSIVGLLFAYFVWTYVIGQQEEKGKNSKRKSAEKTKKTNKWILLGGFLVVSQIVGIPLNLFVFDSLGPISIRWYGLLFAGSIVIGYQWGTTMYRDLVFNQTQIDSLLTHMIVAVVAGARLGHCLFYDPVYYLSNPLKILAMWEGGLASHGAAIGIVLAIYLFSQKNNSFSFWAIMDRMMLLVAVGTAFIRLGNFFNSEIIGEPTDLPWAIVFAQDDLLPRHPTMLYESFSYMLGLGLFSYMYYAFKKKPPEGLLFGVFLIYMFTARFIIEISKTSQAAFEEVFMSMGQWLSIPFILFGIWVLLFVGMKNYKLQQQKL